jgi:hypothetical protein
VKHPTPKSMSAFHPRASGSRSPSPGSHQILFQRWPPHPYVDNKLSRRTRVVDQIVADICIQVQIVSDAGRIRLQKPPQRWRLHADLGIVQPQTAHAVTDPAGRLPRGETPAERTDCDLSGNIRHRGRPRSRTPVTPPGMRVRTGRFEKFRL